MKNLSYPRYLLVLFALFVLMLAGLSSLSHGPKPKMDDVPLDQFSTGRALIHLSDLIDDDQPHPSGTDKNKANLLIIVNKFRALGYAPEVQKTLACTPHYPGCTQVENFIAVLKGTGSGDAIMLTTHYDSVPAGPGAGDAGAGVAALIEIARILKSEPAPINDIIFLITDGEEGGLRGASGFAKEHVLMKSVKLVINLEARGASGPSTMFETNDGNYALIKQFAKYSSHPAANSLSFEIYKRLPNDTDYSVYKRMGVSGLNYAFTGDVALYHSARDDLAHLDKSSLQHHGDNALDALRAFRNIDLNSIQGGQNVANATYFDLFGRHLISWSSKLNIPLSILALLVMAIATYKSRAGWKQGLITAGACVGVILLTVLLGWGLSYPLGHWPTLFYLDHPTPWPGRIALLASAVFSAWAIAKFFGKYKLVGYNMVAASVGVLLALFALITSIVITGAAYQFLVPALAMALGFAIGLWRKHERFSLAIHLGLVTTAYMAFYHFIALEVIVPYTLSYVRVAPLLPLGLVLLPIFMSAGRKEPRTSKIFGFTLGAVTVAATLISAFLPGFNEAHPRIQNLVLEQNAQTSKAHWISETYRAKDEDFLDAAGFHKSPINFKKYDLYKKDRYIKDATYRDLPAPTLTVISDTSEGEERVFVADLQAQNNGYGLNLRFPKGNSPLKIYVNGEFAAQYQSQADKNKAGLNARAFSFRGPGDHIYRIKLVYPKGNVVEFSLQESISIRPNQTDGLADLRPKNSAPGFDGDRIDLFTHLVFQ